MKLSVIGSLSLVVVSLSSPAGALACDQILSVGANIASAIAAAAPGSTICLNAGNYGTVTLTNLARTGFVTLRSASGTDAQLSPRVSNSDYIKFQSLTLSNASLTACSTNIHFLSNRFLPNTSHLSVNNYGAGCSGDMGLLVDGNVFPNGAQSTQEGRVSLGAVNGLTFSNNECYGEPTISIPGSDCLQLWASAANITIGPGNRFHHLSQAECDALPGGAHCDPIQVYMSRTAGSNIVIHGNFFHDNSATLQNANCDPQCPPVTFTNNILKNQGTLFISAPDVVFSHNTIFNLSIFDINWSGASSNTAFQSNITLSSGAPNVATGIRSHNLCDSASACVGSDMIVGSPTFIGGVPSAISTFAGWRLSSGSVGTGSGHDGWDRGTLYFGSDGAPQPSPSPSSVLPSESVVSGPSWNNASFVTHSGIFQAQFDSIPNGSNIDAVTGLSSGEASDYTHLAAIVRFNAQGFIDVRNGSAYASDLSLGYVLGKSYRVRMVIDVPMHRYDVFVTPQGEREVALARGYAFRSEQASVSQLNNRAIYALSGSHLLSNFSVSGLSPVTTTSTTSSTSSSTTTTSMPPASQDTQAPVVSITSPVDGGAIPAKSILSIQASASDNIAVQRVEFYVNGALACPVDVTAPYACSWRVPGGRGKSYQIRANAMDAAGNLGSSSIVNVRSH